MHAGEVLQHDGRPPADDGRLGRHVAGGRLFRRPPRAAFSPPPKLVAILPCRPRPHPFRPTPTPVSLTPAHVALHEDRPAGRPPAGKSPAIWRRRPSAVDMCHSPQAPRRAAQASRPRPTRAIQTAVAAPRVQYESGGVRSAVGHCIPSGCERSTWGSPATAASATTDSAAMDSPGQCHRRMTLWLCLCRGSCMVGSTPWLLHGWSRVRERIRPGRPVAEGGPCAAGTPR